MSNVDVDTKLKAVTDLSTQVDAGKIELSAVQRKLDAAVLDAKVNGAKYREIATASARSVAWVQAVLNRLGYKGSRKAKREAEAAEAAAAV